MSMTRAAVVGAGVVGLAVARELTRALPEATITVIDKAPTVAAHQSGHTAGIVHAGLGHEPGSSGAGLAVRGLELLIPYLVRNGLPYRECGQLIVAQNTDEAERLDDIVRRARDAGVPGVRMLDREQMREVEPQVRGVAALHSPHTAMTDFVALAEALAADVTAAGGIIRLSEEVTAIDALGSGVRVRGRGVSAGEGADEGVSDHSVSDEGASDDGADGDGGGNRSDGSRSAGTVDISDLDAHARFDGDEDDRGSDGDDDAPRAADRPRTYRGREGSPILEIEEELRNRFGETGWFKKIEETIDRFGAGGERGGAGSGSGSSGSGSGGSGGGRDARRPQSDRSRQVRSESAETELGTFDLVIVCAGLHADQIAVAGGLAPEPRIVPFTSDYFIAEEDAAEAVRGIVSSVPDPGQPFLETTIARTLSGGLVLGPNTYPAFGREAYDRSGFSLGDIGSVLGYGGFWKFVSQNARTAMSGAKTLVSQNAFVENVQRFVPAITRNSVRPGPRGVWARPITSAGELVDELSVNARGRLTEVRSVPSTAATSALAIAETVVKKALAATR